MSSPEIARQFFNAVRVSPRPTALSHQPGYDTVMDLVPVLVCYHVQYWYCTSMLLKCIEGIDRDLPYGYRTPTEHIEEGDRQQMPKCRSILFLGVV